MRSSYILRFYFLFFIAVVYCQQVHCQQALMRFAGNRTAAYAGDSGLAVIAALDHPAAICFDQAGDCYIADEINCTIRKVNVNTGIITTIAGNGTAGFAGDSGLSTQSMLNYPNGLSFDGFGRLYIADALNNRVRAIDIFTNIITTVAGKGAAGYSGDGGWAWDAELNTPEGIYAEPSGTVFIADAANNVIRRVDYPTFVITTVAGNDTAGYSGDSSLAIHAELNQPNAVCEDKFGNLYIADSKNSVIRKVVLSTGIITTIAGNGVNGYAGDSSAAINAELGEPIGLTTDDAGNLYIADANNTVRKVDMTTGIIVTMAGDGYQGYSGDYCLLPNCRLYEPNGVAISPAGNLYIADEWNNVVREIVPYTGVEKANPADFLKVYPNPCQGLFTIQLPDNINSAELEINNILGQKVYASAASANKMQVDLSAMPAGIYMLYLKSKENVSVQQIIISR